MLTFKKPELEDLAWIAPLVRQSGLMGCEYAPATLLIWQEKYHTSIGKSGGFYVAKGKDHFEFPAGESQDLKPVLEEMRAVAAQEGFPLRIFGVTPKGKEQLEAAWPGKFRYTPLRGDWDYIYASEDLANLPGKKYHGKRNHISKFERLYSYTYEDITPENREDCRAAAERWCKNNGCAGDYSEELGAISYALDHFEALGLKGGMIKVDGDVAGFTIGEEINDQVFDLHFEKAFPEYNGAYAMINREFARRNLLCYKYINREEDLNLEGLRKAKLSYHPAILLEKSMAEYTGD